jgi:hypothetical protein
MILYQLFQILSIPKRKFFDIFPFTTVKKDKAARKRGVRPALRGVEIGFP